MEQVYVASTSEVIIKVEMASTLLAGVPNTEKYAIAFSSDFFRVNGPQLRETAPPLQVSPRVPSVTASCTATNTGDLPAFDVTGAVQWPTGFSGDAVLSFGNLTPGPRGW